ncbi:integrase arm-type DNA-binding domain-containing protein [Pantoea sp.]|uniref:integrase arm-type DNA-binding domain-containing protein n=1 Tax=Pantoea sp. TaxID=69393 RepID=UPI00338D9975
MTGRSGTAGTHGDSKLWRFRYYQPFTRKRAMLSFGSYPSASLSEACQIVNQPALFSAKTSSLKSTKWQSDFVRRM